MKKILAITFGVIFTMLGLLWFLQGSDLVHINPILCFSNCTPISGPSTIWQIVGTVTFVSGIVIIYRFAKKTEIINKA